MPKRIHNKDPKQPNVALSATNGIPTTAASISAPFVTADPQAAYKHFLPEAQTIAVDPDRRLSVEPTLALHNVEVGVAYFVSVKVEVVRLMPACPVNRYLELPSVALALVFAYDQVVEKASDGEIQARLAECSKLRTPTLKMLEVLADPAVGIADADIVRDIRAGSGGLDKARDAVRIAAYLRELGAKAHGKHPFTEAQLDLLAEHGQWLIGQLTPRNAVVAPTGPDPKAVVRDQMWTLLWSRYDQLRGAVAAVRGLSKLDELVPPLGTRTVGPRKSATTGKEPVPTPAAPPVS